MKHEEKLAFWINVHNAMMMHVTSFMPCTLTSLTLIFQQTAFNLNLWCFQAHIEYGIPQSNSKRILLTKVGSKLSNWIISDIQWHFCISF
jgi:hypothetical protein